MLERLVNLQRMLRAERWPAAHLERLRDAKLMRLLRHARAHVPLYARLHSASRSTDTVGAGGAIDALRELPVVDKAMLRAAGTDAWDGPAALRDVWIATSGSTGAPFRFPISRRYDQWRKAQYLRPYLVNGRGLRDRVLRLTFAPRPEPWFAQLGLLRERQLPCTAAPQEVLDALTRTGATILQGYPSALRLVAHEIRAGRLKTPALRRVFTDSELLTANTRRLLAETFGAPVIDVFGSFETDNIAYQCEQGDGYHVTTDCVVVEVLRHGQPVRDGEAGELVVTVLDNLRSPLIRYNLHDVVRWSRASCGCSRGFPLLEVVNGRSDDELQLPGGERRSAQAVLGTLDAFARDLVHYQLRQYPDLHCELWYVPTAEAQASLEPALRAACAPQLQGLSLSLVRRDSIPLTRSAKLRSFMQSPGDSRAQ